MAIPAPRRRPVFAFWSAPRRARRRRLRAIGRVLSRHGLGFVAGTPLLRWLVPFHWGLLGHERRSRPYTRAEHVRLALEDLGPAAIKLGQILSTRGDLLPPEYQVELARLQDAAPPEPVGVIRRPIEAELGRSIDELFAHFDDHPLAAASLGQAHAARLHDGTDVVVKVRRRGVVDAVELDLDLLTRTAGRVVLAAYTVACVLASGALAVLSDRRRVADVDERTS